jgi:cell division protein FtsN
MNIKCSFCQTPYTLSRMEMLDALQEMDAHQLTHYDAHCPRCRRATRVERKRMEMFFPNWREALKQFEAEMKAHPQHEAPLPQPEAASVAPAESKPQPVKAKPAAVATPAAKASTPKAKPTVKPKTKAPVKKKK